MISAPQGRGGEPVVQALRGHGVFTGYASLFNRRDQAGDIVMPGAFAASLKKRGPDGIRMLFQHDPAEPIGTWLDIAETPKGLFVRGRIDGNVQRGRELISLLNAGGVDGLSIGFKTVLAQKDRTRNARRLIAIDLWEISIVTFPMLEDARVAGTKSRANSRANSLAWARAELLFAKSLTPPTTLHTKGMELNGTY